MKIKMQNAKIKILLAYVLFVLIFCGSIFADTLYLKNGDKITGNTIKEDGQKVVFRIGGEEDGVDVTFFSDEVLRIDKENISNFMNLPFLKDKQISFPRPVLNQQPLITTQAETQQKNLPQEQKQEEAQGNQIGTKKEEFPLAAERGMFTKGKAVIEELMPLLNKEEADYFTRLNSIEKEYMSGTEPIMAQIFAQGPAEDSVKLTDSIKDMSFQVDKITEQLKAEKAPNAFINFHTKYLDSLILIKEVFVDMAKGDAANSQSKIANMQNMQGELSQELEKILAQKKSEK